MNKIYLALILCAFCSGCVQYPMGLSRQQWDALTPAQQAEYQAKQFAIDDMNRQQDAARRVEQQRIAYEEVKAEKERIRLLYANGIYGDIVRVTVQGGFLEYDGRRYPCEPVSVDLVRGELKSVTFYGRGHHPLSTNFNMLLTEDGNTVIFDDSSRQRIVMVNQDWERGQSYHHEGSTRNDDSVKFAGMTFFVKYKELPGAPQRVIIERR